MEEETNAIKKIMLDLIDIAREEGKKFERENGRKPTEEEAKRIAEMIERQFKTALVLSK